MARRNIGISREYSQHAIVDQNGDILRTYQDRTAARVALTRILKRMHATIPSWDLVERTQDYAKLLASIDAGDHAVYWTVIKVEGQ